LQTDNLLPTLIAVGVILLVSFPVHEFAHAATANALGDGTARLFGRMTLNPIKHFDPLGGTLLVISALASGGSFAFGWAKPTPVNLRNLRGGASSDAWVAAAGPLSNLALAAVGAIVLRFMIAFPDSPIATALIAQTVYIFVTLNLLLMLFNLIPIPPLDGSQVLFAFLPPATAYQATRLLGQYGFLILFALVFLPPGNPLLWRVFGPILDTLFNLLVGV
jgi:Zn-dependent protease